MPCEMADSRARLDAWHVDHPGYAGAYRRVRSRTGANDAPPRFSQMGRLTKAEWDNIVAAFGGKCAYCDVELVWDKGYNEDDGWTRDHLVPLALGGLHVADNIVPACRKCNAAKHTTPLRDFLNDEDRYQFICDMTSLI